MKRLSLILVLAGFCLQGCPSTTGEVAVSEEKPIMVTTVDQTLEAMKAGKVVTLVGTALNAKLGGIVQTPMMSAYCVGQHFPDDFEGKMIQVTGKLRVSNDFIAKQDANGVWSQGMAPGSSVTVIEPCDYKLVTID